MTYKEREALTIQAFHDPQVGDRFSEMFSYWVYIVKREGDTVTLMDASPPCTFPGDARVWTGTIAEFQDRYGMHRTGVPSILIEDRGNDVEGWLEGR